MDTADVTQNDKRHTRIPSLDGIRAVAVGVVILGHGMKTMPPDVLRAYTLIAPPPGFGVQIFFVLSGFLITSLLINEKSKTSSVSLKKFYISRAFRIVPAFYVMLVMVAVLQIGGIIELQWIVILASALFVRDYVPTYDSWWLGHTWSLSIEEQFYLIWPLVFSRLRRRSLMGILLTVGAISPLMRAATWFLVPRARPGIEFMFHTRLDGLIAGCVLALLWSDPTRKAQIRAAIERGWVWWAPLWLVFSIGMDRLYGNLWEFSAGYVIDSIAIATVLIWLVERPHSVAGRILNTRPFRAVGLISYSAYLWQQLFMTPRNVTFLGRWPINIVATLVVATLSYWLVEKTFLRLRGRFFAARRDS